MGSMLDYLDWCGDIGFDAKPFNDADNIVLCQLAYLKLDGIVPSSGERSCVTIEEADRTFFKLYSKTELYAQESLTSPMTPFVLRKMAQGSRFASARLSHFELRFDERLHEQFAALHVQLGDDTTFIAFRGTDSTLVGWREDFEMSFATVAAQKDALEYLERTAPEAQGRLRVGGHSKGGNLAAYSAAMCSDVLLDRIAEVYCNDSPGFGEGVLPAHAYERIEGRVRRFVPEFCIIGGLLEQGGEATVVASDAKGLAQHDAMSWQIDASGFVVKPGVSSSSRNFSSVFDDLVSTKTPRERKDLVDAVFDALDSSGATAIHEVASLTPASLGKLLRSFDVLDEHNKEEVELLATSLLGAGMQGVAAPLYQAVERTFGTESSPEEDGVFTVDDMMRFRKRKRRPSLTRLASYAKKRTLARSLVFLTVGLLLMANAEVSAPIVGYTGVVALCAYGISLLMRFFRTRALHESAKPADFLIGVALLVLTVCLLVFQSALVVSCNFVLGVALLLYGFYLVRGFMENSASRDGKSVWMERAKCLIGVLSFVLGIQLLINPTHLITVNIFAAGVIVFGKGCADIIADIRNRREGRCEGSEKIADNDTEY